MKVHYIKLILFSGTVGSIVFAPPIKIELGPETVKKLTTASKEAIQAMEIGPYLKQIDEFVTPERAVHYGKFLSLMLALPYSSRLVWNVIETKLFNIDQASGFSSPGNVVRYGSIAALMLALPYGSNVIWDMLKKNLFAPRLDSVQVDAKSSI